MHFMPPLSKYTKKWLPNSPLRRTGFLEFFLRFSYRWLRKTPIYFCTCTTTKGVKSTEQKLSKPHETWKSFLYCSVRISQSRNIFKNPEYFFQGGGFTKPPSPIPLDAVIMPLPTSWIHPSNLHAPPPLPPTPTPPPKYTPLLNELIRLQMCNWEPMWLIRLKRIQIRQWVFTAYCYYTVESEALKNISMLFFFKHFHFHAQKNGQNQNLLRINKKLVFRFRS